MNLPMNRGEFVGLTACAVASTVLLHDLALAAPSNVQIRTVAFDAFAILDPRPIFALTEEMLPGKETELSQVWRTRQFEYIWLRTVAGCYTDLWHVTEDALIFAAKTLQLDLTPSARARWMNAYLELKPWHDVSDPPANMVVIPPNTFMMDSPTNESPQTVETLTQGFWIGKRETTQAEYLVVAGENPGGLGYALSV